MKTREIIVYVTSQSLH